MDSGLSLRSLSTGGTSLKTAHFSPTALAEILRVRNHSIELLGKLWKIMP